MAHNGYSCGVDTWHTLSTIISLLTCTFQHYWLAIAKYFPITKNKLQLYVWFSILFVIEQ